MIKIENLKKFYGKTCVIDDVSLEVKQGEIFAIVGRSGNLGINEANIYDATSVRLRNIALSYTLPKSLLKNTPITKAKLGISCNNVWMIKSYMNGIDPESVFATGSNATGYEFASSPTTRSFLFNITLGF